MGYELFELNPINPLQLARYRETFSPDGAKDNRLIRSFSASYRIAIAIG
jgi:hypothetical protein